MFTHQCICFRFQLLFQSLHSPWSCQFEPEPCTFWLLSRFQALRPTGRSSRFCCFALSWSCVHSQLIWTLMILTYFSPIVVTKVGERLFCLFGLLRLLFASVLGNFDCGFCILRSGIQTSISLHLPLFCWCCLIDCFNSCSHSMCIFIWCLVSWQCCVHFRPSSCAVGRPFPNIRTSHVAKSAPISSCS